MQLITRPCEPERLHDWPFSQYHPACVVHANIQQLRNLASRIFLGTNPPLKCLWRRNLGATRKTSALSSTRSNPHLFPSQIWWEQWSWTSHHCGSIQQDYFQINVVRAGKCCRNWLGLDSNAIGSTAAMGSKTPSTSGEPLSVSDSPAKLEGVRLYGLTVLQLPLHPPGGFFRTCIRTADELAGTVSGVLGGTPSLWLGAGTSPTNEKSRKNPNQHQPSSCSCHKSPPASTRRTSSSLCTTLLLVLLRLGGSRRSSCNISNNSLLGGRCPRCLDLSRFGETSLLTGRGPGSMPLPPMCPWTQASSLCSPHHVGHLRWRNSNWSCNPCLGNRNRFLGTGFQGLCWKQNLLLNSDSSLATPNKCGASCHRPRTHDCCFRFESSTFPFTFGYCTESRRGPRMTSNQPACVTTVFHPLRQITTNHFIREQKKGEINLSTREQCTNREKNVFELKFQFSHHVLEFCLKDFGFLTHFSHSIARKNLETNLTVSFLHACDIVTKTAIVTF